MALLCCLVFLLMEALSCIAHQMVTVTVNCIIIHLRQYVVLPETMATTFHPYFLIMTVSVFVLMRKQKAHNCTLAIYTPDTYNASPTVVIALHPVIAKKLTRLPITKKLTITCKSWNMTVQQKHILKSLPALPTNTKQHNHPAAPIYFSGKNIIIPVNLLCSTVSREHHRILLNHQNSVAILTGLRAMHTFLL